MDVHSDCETKDDHDSETNDEDPDDCEATQVTQSTFSDREVQNLPQLTGFYPKSYDDGNLDLSNYSSNAPNNSAPSSLSTHLNWHFEEDRSDSKVEDSIASDGNTVLLNQQCVLCGSAKDNHRNVIGQETMQSVVPSISKTQEPVPRERKRWVRPPLVGQAASDIPGLVHDASSLDAVSTVIINEELQHSREDSRNLHRSKKVAKPKSTETHSTNSLIKNVGNVKGISYFTLTDKENNAVRDFKATVEMKETESESLKNAAVFPPFVGNPLCLLSDQSQGINTSGVEIGGGGRAPSPASVSSVTSSRRLEWDSGADVGYQTYQPDENENLENEDFDTLQQLALGKDHSAVHRLEPEGLAGSVQQLSILSSSVQLKMPRISNVKHIFKTPMAMSTPEVRECVNTVTGSTTGTDSETEITPVVKLPAGRFFFSDPENSKHENGNSKEHDPKANNENEDNCNNTLSRKISSSLTDLNENIPYEVSKNSNSLPRSQSHISLSSHKNDKHRTFPFRFQHKSNNGLATCSASSSSIATIVPKHESPRLSDKVIQTSTYAASARYSVGIQVSEVEHMNENEIGRKSTENWASSDAVEEDSDSNIIDRTETDLSRGWKSIKPVIEARSSYFKKLDSEVPQTSMQEFRQLDGNNKVIFTLCKGTQERGNEHKGCSSASSMGNDVASSHDITSGTVLIHSTGNELNNECDKIMQNNMQLSHQSKENIEELFCGTLDSAASSTKTVGSWVVGVSGNNNSSGRRDSTGVVGSANSFEYLPGHVFENNVVDQQLHKSAIAEDSSSRSESSHLSAKSEGDTKLITSWDDSVCSSLKMDLERGVKMLKNLLDSKSYGSSMKKKLVRHVMNRLIETDYAEDSAVLQNLASNVPWTPAHLEVHSSGFISGHIVEGSRHEDLTGGQNVRKSMEREEISGESAGEQHFNRNISRAPENKNMRSSSSQRPGYFFADKCVGRGFSEISGPSSTSEKPHTDSRPETSSGTERCGVSSSVNTLSSGRSYSWKEYSTQSEIEYEHHKHGSESCRNKSVLLNLCETERENQLSWIRTEIHHLSNLKQLLEKQEKLTHHLNNYRKKKKSTINPKINTLLQNEHSDLRLRSTAGSISSHYEALFKQDKYSQNNKIAEISNVKEKKEQCIKESLPSEAEEVKQIFERQTSFTQSRSVLTQIPSPTVLNDSKDYKNKYKKYTKPTHELISTPDSELMSNSSTFEVTAGGLTDSTGTGRINVYAHANNEKNGKSSIAPEISNTARSRISGKSPSLSSNTKSTNSGHKDDTSLCCCECKNFLNKVMSEIKHDKQKDHANTSVKNKSGRKDHPSSLKAIASYDSSKSCVTSSSGTLRETIEIAQDSEDSHKFPVTKETVSVQATGSRGRMPWLEPKWSSVPTLVTNKNVIKETSQKERKCPCCGNVEPDPVEPDMNDWKCARCMKLQHIHKVRKCQKCGILESEQVDISQEETFLKNNDCEHELEIVTSPRINFGKEQQKYDKNDQGDTLKNISASSQFAAHRPKAKSPLGYVLTLESTTGSGASTIDRSEKKSLQEIKMSIPLKRQQSASVKEKEQKTSKKDNFRSRSETCSKENQKPLTGSCNEKPSRSQMPQRDLTLQEYLIVNRPDFIQSAEYRRQCLDEIAYLRELRQKSKHKLLALATHSSSLLNSGKSCSLSIESIPPPPLAVKRVFSQQSMRAQTERKYHNLPEVLNKKVEKKRKEDYRTNRLMAEIFAKKLQKKVLRGEVNLSNSRSVISAI